MSSLPAISGNELLKLYRKNNWAVAGRTRHGVAIRKLIGDRTRLGIIPTGNRSLPIGTLMAIIGPKQTGIGRAGFLAMIDKYG